MLAIWLHHHLRLLSANQETLTTSHSHSHSHSHSRSHTLALHPMLWPWPSAQNADRWIPDSCNVIQSQPSISISQATSSVYLTLLLKAKLASWTSSISRIVFGIKSYLSFWFCFFFFFLALGAQKYSLLGSFIEVEVIDSSSFFFFLPFCNLG